MKAAVEAQVSAYADGHEHLADELRHLDLVLRIRAARFRAEARPLQEAGVSASVYVSDAEVDALLSPSPGPDDPGEDLARERMALLENRNARISASLEGGVALPLLVLAQVFRLSPLETQALLICLAPELDRKYDRVYAYLQDDIARKKPSLDLVLDLLAADAKEKWRMRSALSERSPLFAAKLLIPVEDAHSPSGSSGLARFLKLDPRILHFLLGHAEPDPRLAGKLEGLPPLTQDQEPLLDPGLLAEARDATRRHLSRQGYAAGKLVWNFHGPRGVGKRSLARWIGSTLQCPLLAIDVDWLLADAGEEENPFIPAFREGLLLQAAIYLHSFESLKSDAPRAAVLAKKLARAIADFGWLTFLGSEEPWAHKAAFQGLHFRSLALPLPERRLREAAWRQALALGWPASGETHRKEIAAELSGPFRLTPGRIHKAASDLRRAEGEGPLPVATRFHLACRDQVGRRLGEFAARLEPGHGWEDLVLAKEKIRHLQEICDQLRHSHRVFAEWGFEAKLSYGKGLSALFCGPPGTGKTLAAQVLARELGLELYKIDLSGVVSKYIGETEKNLQRVFQEAGSGGAILFFDEADALFGKRTDVSDAHDRYANIETSFLLQKMEEYEGMVILASNLRDNMDEAFVRRLRFIVDFGFPEAADREAIWKAHFPSRTPVESDVDCAFLARTFPVTGGNIKNIVLNAAFLAAGNGGAIGMKHLMQGAKREYEKIGKLWTDRPAAGARVGAERRP